MYAHPVIIVIIIIIIVIIIIIIITSVKLYKIKNIYKNQVQLQKAGQQEMIKTYIMYYLAIYILRNSKIAIKNVLNLSK